MTIFQKGDPLSDIELVCDTAKGKVLESYPIGVSVDYQIYENGVIGLSEKPAVRFEIGVATIYASSLPPVRKRYLIHDIDFHKDINACAQGIADWIVGDIDRYYERGVL